MNQITRGASSTENIIDTEDMYFGVAQKGLN